MRGRRWRTTLCGRRWPTSEPHGISGCVEGDRLRAQGWLAIGDAEALAGLDALAEELIRARHAEEDAQIPLYGDHRAVGQFRRPAKKRRPPSWPHIWLRCSPSSR